MKKVLLGKEFHFGIGFLNELIDGTGKNLQEISNEVINNAPVMVPQMMYYSLAYSYKRSQKELDFNLYDVHDWIDDNGGIGNGFFEDFLTAFMEAMYKDVPVDNSKKKVKAAK